MSAYSDDYGTPDEQSRNQRKIADLLRAEEGHDGNEFEGLTPRELRNAIRTLQEDLRRAVGDRRKLITVVRSAIIDTDHSNVNYLSERFRKVLAEVEGK